MLPYVPMYGMQLDGMGQWLIGTWYIGLSGVISFLP